jgi:hypothetical protein
VLSNKINQILLDEINNEISKACCTKGGNKKCKQNLRQLDEGKQLHGKYRHRWDSNIKMYLTGTGFEDALKLDVQNTVPQKQNTSIMDAALTMGSNSLTLFSLLREFTIRKYNTKHHVVWLAPPFPVQHDLHLILGLEARYSD